MRISRRFLSIAILFLLVAQQTSAAMAAAVLFQDDSFNDIKSDTVRIGSNDAGANNTAIQFGSDVTASENGNITWNISTNKFGIDHSVDITGGLSANAAVDFTGATYRGPQGASDPATCSVGQEFYNTTSNALKVCTSTNTWTIAVSANGADLLDGVDSSQFLRSDTSDSFTSGTLTTDNGTTFTVNGVANIGDNGDAVAVNSNTWDISAAGVASGLTGLTTTGTADFSGTTFIAPQGASTPGTCTVGQWFYNTTVNQTNICTATNVFSPQLRTDTSQSFTAGTLTFNSGTTLTSNGAVNFTGATSFRPPQGASDPATCTVGQEFYNTTSNVMKICTASNVWSPQLRTDTSQSFTSGTLTFNSGTTLTDNGTLATTGVTTLGNNSNTVAVDSSSWDISTAGVASGFTGITSSGSISFTAGATISGGTINLNDNSNNPVNIGTGSTTSTVTVGGTGTQTISVGNGAGVKTVNVGSSNTTSTTTILSGSGGVLVNDANNQPTSIGTGTSTGTVTLGGTGTQTIAVGNGAGVKTVNVGSSNTTSTTTLLSGSGGVKINDTNNQPTSIGTGTTTGTVNIGNGTSTQSIAIGNPGSAAAKTIDIGDGSNTGVVNIGNTTGGVVIGGGTAVKKHLSGTASLNYGATAARTCDALTITVTGAADGDTVTLGIPTALAGSDANQNFWGYVSATDTVTVKRCDITNAALSNPAAATVRADVWQH